MGRPIFRDLVSANDLPPDSLMLPVSCEAQQAVTAATAAAPNQIKVAIRMAMS